MTSKSAAGVPVETLMAFMNTLIQIENDETQMGCLVVSYDKAAYKHDVETGELKERNTLESLVYEIQSFIETRRMTVIPKETIDAIVAVIRALGPCPLGYETMITAAEVLTGTPGLDVHGEFRIEFDRKVFDTKHIYAVKLTFENQTHFGRFVNSYFFILGTFPK